MDNPRKQMTWQDVAALAIVCLSFVAIVGLIVWPLT